MVLTRRWNVPRRPKRPLPTMSRLRNRVSMKPENQRVRWRRKTSGRAGTSVVARAEEELVVLDVRGGVEAAHGDERVAAKDRERARDQDERPRVRPRDAPEEGAE